MNRPHPFANTWRQFTRLPDGERVYWTAMAASVVLISALHAIHALRGG